MKLSAVLEVKKFKILVLFVLFYLPFSATILLLFLYISELKFLFTPLHEAYLIT